MHAGTIFWNGSDLSLIGKPKINIRRNPDPPPPGIATRMLVSLTVTVDLEALDPGTIQARAEWLAASMRVGEGILSSQCGSGHAPSWLAAPGESNLGEVLAGLTNSVTLAFTAIENHASETVAAFPGAVFTPAGDGAAPLILHAVRDFKQDIKTSRHAERNGSRSITTTTLSFTARYAQANAADPLATRLAYLQGQAAAVKALDASHGILIFGEVNSIVRVTDFTPQIDERAGILDVQVQCYHIMLPDVGTAECVYDIDEKVEEGNGEVVLSISGEISAEDRSIALAKLELLRAAQNIPGQRITGYSTKDKIIDGHDTAVEGSWTGTMSFAMEVRKILAGGHHTLRISTQKDIKSGMKWSYAGSVKSATSADALAIARAIASAAAHPIMVRSEETIEAATGIDNSTVRQFIKLDFSYEFEGPSDGFISGEITTETTSPLAGEWRQNTSGFLLASTKAAAEERLALLLAADRNALDVSRRWSETYLDPGDNSGVKRVAMKLDFTSSVRVSRTRTAVEMTDSTQTSISSMRQTRSISGTLWASSKSAADTGLTALITTLFGTNKPQEITSTHSEIRMDNPPATSLSASQWIKLDFSLSRVSRLTGVVGYDLLEASLTVERTGSINMALVTPIPFSRPVVQTGIGYSPGRISINATAKSISFLTGKNWVQAKRALVSTFGNDSHETEPPRETSTPDLAPFSGSEVACYGFSGSYAWTFVGTSLDGTWNTLAPA